MSLLASPRLRFLSLLLCLCVLFNSTAFAAAPLDPAGARQQLLTQGVSSTVRITRKDGHELKGQLLTVGDESCVLTVKKAPVTVAYADISKVRGPGLSRGVKIAIGVGVFVVAVGITAAIIGHEINTGFPKTIPI